MEIKYKMNYKNGKNYLNLYAVSENNYIPVKLVFPEHDYRYLKILIENGKIEKLVTLEKKEIK